MRNTFRRRNLKERIQVHGHNDFFLDFHFISFDRVYYYFSSSENELKIMMYLPHFIIQSKTFNLRLKFNFIYFQ